MMRIGTGLVVALAALAWPTLAAAGDPQGGGLRNERPDFLFGRPTVSVGVRGALTMGRAGSDWYDFVTEQLTLDRNDFRTGGIAGDAGVAITPRLEVVGGAAYTSRTKQSEFRHFVEQIGNTRLPITQATRLRQATFTGGVRYALVDRGRELSALAWVPRRLVPYVGGGGGALWYEVEQSGDFVDFQDFSIFTDVLRSSGWTPLAYVNGGADLNLTRAVYLTLDARYQWAAPELKSPWAGFEPLDMSGLLLSTGITVAF